MCNLHSINIVRDRILKISNNQVPVKLREVDEIPHDRGKSKFILSEIK